MKDKVVIITGAASGIGRALAFECAKRGAKLAIADMNSEKLADCGEQLAKKGTEVLHAITNVSNESDCKNLVEQTVDKFGRIDVLINNAGISMRALFEETSLDVLRKVMDVNFWGTVYCTKFALPYLLKSQGSVTGISSVAGYKGLPGRTGYSASKFAMQGFLEVIRIENMKKDLHVLIAVPGFTSTNIRNSALAKDGSQQGESPRDEAKMMSSEEVAVYIWNAIEKRKHRLTLTRQGKMTVLLNKFFPKFMDKMVYNHMAKETDSPF
ncbi:MAG: SDR family oxidoreductase [Bacteroidales bacterium]|nr:SDR family oxidoreductase [Bacteroidota bacterium]MBL6949654.1 SDR family oxidoreductase [Bacteroidales bacterium]